MSSRPYSVAHDAVSGLLNIHVRAALDGSNDPTLDDGCAAYVSSIKRTSQGLYTITLKDPFVAVKACHAGIEAATLVNLLAQTKAIDLTTNKTVKVDLYKMVSTGSGSDATPTLTDPPAAASNATFLDMLIVARNTVSKA